MNVTKSEQVCGLDKEDTLRAMQTELEVTLYIVRLSDYIDIHLTTIKGCYLADIIFYLQIVLHFRTFCCNQSFVQLRGQLSLIVCFSFVTVGLKPHSVYVQYLNDLCMLFCAI